jgi:DNA repair exonuclease SbcCD nuclease subunit
MAAFVIGDLHFGRNQNNTAYLDSLEAWAKQRLLPALADTPGGPHDVVLLGDVFDNRTSVNVAILNAAQSFIERLSAAAGTVYIVLGNHDVYYRTSLHLNAVQPIVKDLKNVKVIDERQVVVVGVERWLMVPWATDVLAARHEIARNEWPDADVVVGHFEIASFYESKVHVCDGGFAPSDFKKWPTVFSGHFHIPQQTGNIRYVGSPIELDWMDSGITKGFVIRDTGKEVEVVTGVAGSRHIYIPYDGGFPKPLPEVGKDWLRVVLGEVKSSKALAKDIEKLRAACPDILSLETTGDFSIGEGEATASLNVQNKDTIELLLEYITGLALPPGVRAERLTALAREANARAMRNGGVPVI